jgi:FkbM family methyltransferase
MIRTRLIQVALNFTSVKQRKNLLRLAAASLGIGETSIDREVNTFVKLLDTSEPDPLILDIGAHVGEWSLKLKSKIPGARIDLFEPVEYHHEKLESLTAKGQLSNSNLIKYGISAQGGSLKILSPTLGSGAASIVDVNNSSYIYSENIETQTLHSVIRSRPELVGIKIDIEGAEFDILSNSAQAISSSRIQVIQFEFGEKSTLLKQSFRMFYDYFKEINFRLFRSTDKELLAVEECSMWDEIHVNTVYFAKRQSKVKINC